MGCLFDSGSNWTQGKLDRFAAAFRQTIDFIINPCDYVSPFLSTLKQFAVVIVNYRKAFATSGDLEVMLWTELSDRTGVQSLYCSDLFIPFFKMNLL